MKKMANYFQMLLHWEAIKKYGGNANLAVIHGVLIPIIGTEAEGVHYAQGEKAHKH